MKTTKEALILNLSKYNLTIDEIQKYADNLTGREKQIIFMRFGLLGSPKSMMDIGFHFDLSHARVHQLVHEILQKIEKMKEKDV